MTGSDEDYVGKFTSDENVARELIVSERLRKSNADWEPFVGVLLGDSCDVNLKEQLYIDCESVSWDSKNAIYPSRCVGVSLHEYLKRRITWKWLWTTFHHLLNGLKLLHSLGIHHHDINAKNILVDERGTARLIDFGLAIIDPTPEGLEKIDIPISGNPLFYNLYIYRHNIERMPINDLYTSYEHLSQFYFPSYEKYTASDYIQTAIEISRRARYDSNVVIPNFEKIDVYQLADVINDSAINNKTVLFEEDPHNKAYAANLKKTINKCLHIDVNQQWTVDRALAHMNKLKAV